MTCFLKNGWRLVLASLLGALALSALAQSQRRIEDSMAERTRACTACHGAAGQPHPRRKHPVISQ